MGTRQQLAAFSLWGTAGVTLAVAAALGIARLRYTAELPVSAPPHEQPGFHEFTRAPFDPDNPFGLSAKELAASREVQLPADTPAEEAAEDDFALQAAPPPPFFQDRFRAPPLRQPDPHDLEERLAPVAAAPTPVAPPPEPSPPTSPAPAGSVEGEIDQFLDRWKRTILDRDYDAHRALGFSTPEVRFERRYGRGQPVAVTFVQLGHSKPEPGLVKAGVRMTYVYRDHTGSHLTETLHRIVFRHGDGPLRYAGTWD